MDIQPDEVEVKEVVGQYDGSNVVYIKTVGGWHMIVKASPVPELLSVGPHRAIAKKIARQQHPEIALDFGELSKNDDIVNNSYFDLLVAKYDLLVTKINNKKK